MEESFIARPNLPTAPVTLCAVGIDSLFLLPELSMYRIKTLQVFRSSHLHKAVADHPDLRMLHLGGEEILIEQGDSVLRSALEAYGFRAEYIEKPLGPVYPQDVLLDVALVGNYLFHGRAALEPPIQDYCAQHKLKTVSTAQGYAKCSVCVVTERALITSDPSIRTSARKCGLDVLQIRPGFIQLPGYSYGFIGGCSGKLHKNLLAFSGNISLHPDYPDIKAFCNNYHVELISLSNHPLLDVGGILPLKQIKATQEEEGNSDI